MAQRSGRIARELPRHARIHFSGQFLADPSTLNNSATRYNPAAPPAPVGGDNWNPNGSHFFSFANCKVTSVWDQAGALKATAADDPAVGATIDTSDVAMAKLVDMPVTRDLSKPKRDMILKWLKAGAPK